MDLWTQQGKERAGFFFFNENFQRSFKDKSFVSSSWYLSWYHRDFSQYILACLLTLQHLHLQYLFLVTSIPKMKLCICFWKNYYECSFFTYYLHILRKSLKCFWLFPNKSAQNKPLENLLFITHYSCEISQTKTISYDTTYCCSVTKLCPTFWYPMDCSLPSFLVLHYLPEFAQTHVH